MKNTTKQVKQKAIKQEVVKQEVVKQSNIEKSNQEDARAIYIKRASESIASTIEDNFVSIGKIVYEARTSEYAVTLSELSKMIKSISPRYASLASVSRLSECYNMYLTFNVEKHVSYEKIVKDGDNEFTLVKTAIDSELVKGLPYNTVLGITKQLAATKGSKEHLATVKRIASVLSPNAKDVDVKEYMAAKECTLAVAKPVIAKARITRLLADSRTKKDYKPVNVSLKVYNMLKDEMEAQNAELGENEEKFTMKDILDMLLFASVDTSTKPSKKHIRSTELLEGAVSA